MLSLPFIQWANFHTAYKPLKDVAACKQNKSIRERQVSYDLTDVRNLRNKTEDHKGREGKMKQNETREGEKP